MAWEIPFIVFKAGTGVNQSAIIYDDVITIASAYYILLFASIIIVVINSLTHTSATEKIVLNCKN